jgi:hypothetical protein
MTDWKFVQRDPEEALAQLYFFSVKKKHPAGDMDVRITVQEFATPKLGVLQFFARADIEVNQNTATFEPVGWGDTLTSALSECLKNLRRFEFEGPAQPSVLPPD